MIGLFYWAYEMKSVQGFHIMDLQKESLFMKHYRRIEKTIQNPSRHWVGNGFNVQQYFPSRQGMSFMERFSPFILMDYNAPSTFKGTNDDVGVDIHPHRGFETVTFAFKGKVEHGDNHGHSGVIQEGDIQWMTAGSGVLHKEFHEKEWAKHDRVFHMIQLWVNLPAKDKMTQPNYQALTKGDIGSFVDEKSGAKVILYAGEAFNHKGVANTFSPMNIFKIALRKGQHIDLNEPNDFNLGFLVISGSVEVNEDKVLQESDFVLFRNEAGLVEINALEDAEVFVLSGKPLNEPVVAGGPFVMNTEDELRQAYLDYQSGKFGSFDF